MANEIEKVRRFALGSWFGCQTVYGYFGQFWIGRVHLHIFHKPDPSEVMHDHPWSFVSFPFSSYVEEYLEPETGEVKFDVIRRFRLNRKSASHTHRYLGKWSGKYVGGVPTVVPGRVVTICLRGAAGRPWHYWRLHKGHVRKYPWLAYLRHVGHLPSKCEREV